MPGIRIPIALRRALHPEGSALATVPPGRAHIHPQPPMTDDDPRLRAFLRVNFDVLYDWNIQSGAISFAEQLDELLGFPPGGFPRDLAGWLQHVHPDDHDAVCADLWRSVTEAQSFHGEYRLRRYDGSYITVNDQAITLSDSTGQPTNMIGAMRDITDEREAERARREAEELRNVLFKIGKPAMQIDASGRYIDVAPAALQFFARSADEMLGANVRDDFPKSVLDLVGPEAKVDEGGVELEVDCTVAGTVKTLMLTVIPCHLEENEHGFFLLGTDITAQKSLQNDLARSERALRSQTTILDERNTALRVLLEQRENDRAELEQRIISNVDHLIEPTLDRLSRQLRHRSERFELEALRVNLHEIIGPFAQHAAHADSSHQALTRREMEVANLVRLGRTSDEIAEALHISRSSVAFHRTNIRRKLGLAKRGPHLGTHLAALGSD